LQSLYKQNDKLNGGIQSLPLKKSIEQQCTTIEHYEKYCEDKGTQPENKLDDKSVQTVTVSTTEESIMINSNEKDSSHLNEKNSQPTELNEKQDTKDTSVLSRDKILKLLDQAQINTPLGTSKNNTGKEEYANILDASRRHRQVVPLEKLLFGDC